MSSMVQLSMRAVTCARHLATLGSVPLPDCTSARTAAAVAPVQSLSNASWHSSMTALLRWAAAAHAVSAAAMSVGVGFEARTLVTKCPISF